MSKDFLTLDEWTDALVNKNYEQARGQLRTQTGFCCLGVYCNEIAPSNWGEDDDGFAEFHWKGDWETASLPKELLEESFLDGSSQLLFTLLNDAYWTFLQIATLAQYLEKIYGLQNIKDIKLYNDAKIVYSFSAQNRMNRLEQGLVIIETVGSENKVIFYSDALRNIVLDSTVELYNYSKSMTVSGQ